ncbi:MAG: sporulation initiation factor Spo0A C-terminal domain-containing protein [Eubacteriales bacterium]|nr:sporulation initiation factor Spo0A C-terminal domain-containing protein [Eubacteriales bacterium]
MLSVIQVMLASEDSTFSKLFFSTAQPAKGLSVIGMYPSGLGLMDAIRRDHPDVLLLDLMLPGVNAWTILHEINLLAPERRPAVYILSSFESSETIAECRRLGARFFLRKPVHMEQLTELIIRYGVSQPHMQNPSRHDIFVRVTQILQSLQVPAHVAGYGYVRECIMMVLDDASPGISVTKVLYPAVGNKNHASWTSVERDIRNAIELAWKRCNGYMPGFSAGRRPSNREFIFTIADRVRYETHIDLDHFADEP